MTEHKLKDLYNQLIVSPQNAHKDVNRYTTTIATLSAQDKATLHLLFIHHAALTGGDTATLPYAEKTSRIGATYNFSSLPQTLQNVVINFVTMRSS